MLVLFHFHHSRFLVGWLFWWRGIESLVWSRLVVDCMTKEQNRLDGRLPCADGGGYNIPSVGGEWRGEELPLMAEVNGRLGTFDLRFGF